MIDLIEPDWCPQAKLSKSKKAVGEITPTTPETADEELDGAANLQVNKTPKSNEVNEEIEDANDDEIVKKELALDEEEKKGEEVPENNNSVDPGWNRDKADCLTLGELFLMLGTGGGGSNVIELCYTWLPKQGNARQVVRFW